MPVITISAASRALLEADASSHGNTLRGPVQAPGGRFFVELEDDVLAALARVDPDPDVAIRTMYTTGVGHS